MKENKILEIKNILNTLENLKKHTYYMKIMPILTKAIL